MSRTYAHFALLLALTLVACTQTRMRRYSEMIDPYVGSGKKEALDKMLGQPVSCKQDGVFQKCEYRTASGRNVPTPVQFAKTTEMPDVSPYEYFDVLHLFFDDQRVLKEWQPIVLTP